MSISKNLFNRYSRDIEEEEKRKENEQKLAEVNATANTNNVNADATLSVDDQWAKFKKKNDTTNTTSESADKKWETFKSNGKKSGGSFDVVTDMLDAGAASYAAAKQKAKEDRAAQLPELEKIKSGESAPTYVTESQSVLNNMDPKHLEALKLLNEAVYNDDMSSAVEYKNELVDLTGWDDQTIGANIKHLHNVNDYETTKASGKKTANLTAEQEYTYSQAKIEALSKEEQAAMNMITDGLVGRYGKQAEFMDNAYSDISYGTHAMGTVMSVANIAKNAKDTNNNSGNTQKISDAKKKLKKLGWSDEKINEYMGYAQYIANQKGNDEYMKQFNIDPNASTKDKIWKGIENTAYDLNPSRLISRGAAAVASNFEKRPEGFGKSTTSILNMPNNASTYAKSQVSENAIGSKHPIGQVIYNGAVSAAESAEEMMMFSKFAGPGASWLSRAATLIPFGLEGYASGYADARSRGALDADASTYGKVTGAVEMATEMISLDHFWKMASGTKAGSSALINFGTQSLIEGSEEVAADVLNRVGDETIFGDQGIDTITYKKNQIMANDPTKTEQEAKAEAEKDYWKNVATDFATGTFAGSLHGGAGVAMGVANYNAENRAIRENFENYENEGTTDYDQQLRDQASEYAANPAKYRADVINPTSKSSRIAADIANKVAEKGKANIIDKIKYNQAMANVVDEEASLSESQAKYNDYVEQVSSVPKVFRTAQTGITYKEGMARMQEAVENNNLKALSDAYSLMKNSINEEARENADMALESMKGKSEGISNLEIDGLKTMTQDAYIAGAQGVERGEMGVLTQTAQEAYDAGRIQYLEKSKYTVNNAEAVKKASVTTEHGGEVLIGSIESGKIKTESGKLIDVADIEGESVVKELYKTAVNYDDKIANLIIDNVKDGDNIINYTDAANRAITAGRMGLSQDKFNGTFYGKILGDRASILYKAGAQEAFEEFQNTGFKEIKTKTNSKIVGFTNHSSAEIDTTVLRLIANTAGINIDLYDPGAVDASGVVIFGEKENAKYVPSENKIYLRSDQIGQLFHEFGELTQAYNSEGYEIVRKALVESASEIIGSEAMTAYKESYQNVYAAANDGHKMTDWQITSEMANDLIAVMLNTEEGRKALSDNLVNNYTANEARSIVDKIKQLYNKVMNSLKSLLDKVSYGNGTMQSMVDKYNDGRLQKNLDLFFEAFNTALANYQEINGISKDMLAALDDNADAITDEAGNVQLVVSEDKSTILVNHSLSTMDDTNEKLYNVMIENGYTKAEAQKAVDSIKSQAQWLIEVGANYAEMAEALNANVDMTLTTDVNKATQVFRSFVTNGDYALNIDFLTICKKRQAYMKVLTDLIDNGIFNQVVFNAPAIADVNDILRGNGFETACLGCFVESRRLQIQKWANTFASEWNEAVRNVNKNATPFSFSGKRAADISSMSYEDIASLESELRGLAKNDKGNVKLAQGSSVERMADLLKKVPSLAHTIEAGDLIKPANIRELRRTSRDLYSLVQSRYGTASPKIVQEFNPYNGEIADLSQGFMQSINGSNIAGMGIYNKWAKNTLDKAIAGKEIESLPVEIQEAVDRFVENYNKEGKGKKNKNYKSTTKNKHAQQIALMKYAYDVGGVRLQSFSDFLIENVLDYFQLVGDMYGKHLPMHAYSKEISFARIFGMTGMKINMSLIPVIDRAAGKENAGLNSKGEYAGWGDFKHHIRMGGQSFVQSIGFQDALALQYDPRYSGNVGTIAIGVSDKHIIKMLNDNNIRMVIPYHSSGMNAEFAKRMDIDLYNDYTDYQNTRVNAGSGKATSKYNLGSCTFEFDGQQITIDGEFNFNESMQRHGGDAKKAAGEYLAWCAAEHNISNKEEKYTGVTFAPKFSASPYGYDFTKEANYYKLLEDFNVYDYDGNVARQTALTMTYPSGLNSEQEAVYRQRLEESGLFSVEEIEDYVKKAQRDLQQIVTDEASVRNKYHRDADAKYDDTFKQISDKLMTDHRMSLSVDSEGNELTDAQVEFFKDSKVRDENGNLLVMYHGTKSEFTVFDPRKFGGVNGIAEGYGIYLTDNSEVSKAYGSIMKVYANVTNPASSDLKSIKPKQLSKLIEVTCKLEATRMMEEDGYDKIEDALKDTWISNYVYTYDIPITNAYMEVASQIVRQESSDFGIIQEVMSGMAIRSYENAYDFYDVLKSEMGIDGFATEWEDPENPGKTSKIVLALDSNQVKNVDNENPTFDPDIRYSITFDDFISDDELSETIMEELEDDIILDSKWNASIDDILAALEESINSETKKERKKAQRHLTRAALGSEFQVRDGKTVALTDERIEKYMHAFAASNKDYAQAYITYMSPADFLLLTANGNKGDETFQRIKSESHELDWDQFKGESQPIFLDLDEKGIGGATKSAIVGHEGRHRMFALQMAGYTKVPVLVFNYANKYSKSHIDNITVDPQRYNMDTKYNKSNKITLNDLEVLSTGNQDTVIEKFGSGAKADVRYSINANEHNYDYDTLRKKGNIEIYHYSDFGLTEIEFSEDLKAGDVARIAKKNVAQYNKTKGNNLGNNMLYNKDLDAVVLIDSEAFKHGLKHVTQGAADAKTALPLYFENAIVFNEADGLRKEADNSYILYGAYNDGNDLRVARIIVNHYDGGYTVSDIENVMYATTSKKEEAAAHMAAPLRAKSSYGTTPSEITVTQLMYVVKKTYPNEVSEDVANHLLYKRGQSDIKGLRYSLSMDDFLFSDEFLDESEKTFKASASILEEGMEALKNQKVDKKTVTKIASKIISEYGSTAKVKVVADELEKAFAYMQTEDHVSYDSMMRVMSEIATPILDQANEKVGQEVYDEFIDNFNGLSIKLSSMQKVEVAKIFGTYNNFRIAMSPIRISENGKTSLDTIWSELCEQTGMDEDTREAEMPLALYDTLQALKPTVVNEYNENMEEASKDLAMRIVEEYLGTQDIAGAKEATNKAKEQLKAYRQTVKNNYTQRLGKVKADLKQKASYNLQRANVTAAWREAELKQRYEKKIAEIKQKQAEELAKVKSEAKDAADYRVKRAEVEARWREAELKAKQEAALDNKNDKIAEIQAKNKEQARKQRERYEANKQRTAIEKKANTLLTWINNPSEKNHVPEGLKPAIIGVLQSLDFVTPTVTYNKGVFSVRVYDHMEYNAEGSRVPIYQTITGSTEQEVLDKYRQAINEGMGSQKAHKWTERMSLIQELYDKIDTAQDYYKDFDMVDFVGKLDADLATDLRDMTSDARENNLALSNLTANHLKVINNVLSNITKAIRQGNKAYSMNHDMTELGNETISTSEERKKDPKYRKIMQTFRIDMATPKVFMKQLGASGDSLYKSLRRGFNTKVMDIKAASEYMQEVMKDVTKTELKEWTGKNAKIYTFELEGGTIRMTGAEIMSLYKSSQRDGFMNRVQGGIESAERVEGKKQVPKSKRVRVTAEDIATIIGVLSDKQKAVADRIQSYMATECTKQGNEVSMDLYGYEKFAEENYFPYSVDKNTTATTDKNMNNAKVTGIEHSGFTNSLKKGANNPLIMRDIFDVFTDHVTDMANYHGMAASLKDTLRWFNYKTENTTVKDSIDKIVGIVGSNTYIQNLLVDLNQSERSRYVGNITDKLIANYKAAAVAGNIRVIVQQPTAFTRALSMINAKHLIRACAHPIAARSNRQLANDKSAIMWWKSQGYFETSVGKSMKEVITGQTSTRDKVMNATMWGIGKADDVTWGFLYTATQYEVLSQNPGKTVEELRDQINDRFDEIIDMTQVVDSTLHRSQYMRSKDKLNVIQTAFMAEPTKKYNMIMDSLLDAQNGKGTGTLVKVLAAVAITDAINAAMQSLIDAIRKKKKDEELEDVFEENYWINLIDNINPFNMFPIFKDIASSSYQLLTGQTLYGNSNSRFDMEAINATLAAAQEIKKQINGESNKTAWGTTLVVLKPLSYITGIPLYNLARDTTAVGNAITNNAIATVAEKDSDKYTNIFTAIENGKDQETIDNYVAKAVEKGGTVKDIQSKIKSKYRSDYFDAYTEDPDLAEDIAEKAKKGMKALKMTDEEITKTLNEWAEESVTYAGLDAAIKSGEGIDEAMAKVREAKEDDKIVDHIYNTFGSTVDYVEATGVDSNVEENVNKALKLIDSKYTYDSVKSEKKAKEKESEANKAKTEYRASEKSKIYSAVDSGSDYKSACDNLLKDGVKADSIKSDITRQYKDTVVKNYKAGKDVQRIISRIATIKAYIDKQSGFKLDNKWNGDYYEYEYNEVMKWFK